MSRRVNIATFKCSLFAVSLAAVSTPHACHASNNWKLIMRATARWSAERTRSLCHEDELHCNHARLSCQCASNKTGRAKMINRRRLSHLHLGRLVPSAKASAALLPVSPPSSDASMPLSMPLSRKAFQSAGRLRSSRIAPVVVGASAPDIVAAVPAGTPMCSRSGRNQGAASLSLACSMCRLHVRRNRRSASERRSSTQRREYRPGTVPVQYRYPYM